MDGQLTAPELKKILYSELINYKYHKNQLEHFDALEACIRVLRRYFNIGYVSIITRH